MRAGPFCAVMLAALLMAASPARAQNYPAGPVKIVVPAAAGGSIDVIARLVADQLARTWNQQVLILNHSGGGTGIGARVAATATPDGSTLFFGLSSTFVALPVLQPSLGIDVGRDFVPIGFVGEQPMVIAATPSLGVNSLADLIASAKKEAGGLNCAVTQSGGLSHLSGELLRRRAGIALTFVHYPGTAQALNDIVGGRMPMIVESLPGLIGAIQGRQLRPLAVAAAQRLPNFPDLPPAAETLSEFVATGWFVLMGPPGMPRLIADKAGQDLNDVLARPELKQKFAELGTYTRAMTPAELKDFIASQQALWRPLVQQFAAKPQ
jgi:tripartite-type tricarboxylate transporter receptor subunit TctC